MHIDVHLAYIALPRQNISGFVIKLLSKIISKPLVNMLSDRSNFLVSLQERIISAKFILEMYSVFPKLIENLIATEFRWSENPIAKVFKHYKIIWNKLSDTQFTDYSYFDPPPK